MKSIHEQSGALDVEDSILAGNGGLQETSHVHRLVVVAEACLLARHVGDQAEPRRAWYPLRQRCLGTCGVRDR